MTRVEITIQDGKITWIEQQGEQLPNWDELVCAVTNVVEERRLNYEGKRTNGW